MDYVKLPKLIAIKMLICHYVKMCVNINLMGPMYICDGLGLERA